MVLYLYRAHYYHIVSAFVGQLVLNLRTNASGDDSINSIYGGSVNSLIQKFSNQDKLQELEDEASYNREQAMKLASEKRELELELQDLRNYSQKNAPMKKAMPGNQDESSRKLAFRVII